MKKYLLSLILLGLFPHYALAKEVILGSETVKPLKYPKFSLSSDYSLGNQFILLSGDYDISHEINDSIGFSIISEAGLLRYLNAGFIVNVGAYRNFPDDLMFSKMQLYIKPYFPIMDRIAIFARVGLGPGVYIPVSAPGSSLTIEQIMNVLDLKRSRPREPAVGVGLNGSLTAGIEFFPLSRIGISFEAGIKADIIWQLLYERQHYYSPNEPPPVYGAGDSLIAFNYLTYGFPLMLTLHFIL